jgi:hypothetical protein
MGPAHGAVARTRLTSADATALPAAVRSWCEHASLSRASGISSRGEILVEWLRSVSR